MNAAVVAHDLELALIDAAAAGVLRADRVRVRLRHGRDPVTGAEFEVWHVLATRRTGVLAEVWLQPQFLERAALSTADQAAWMTDDLNRDLDKQEAEMRD